MNEKIAHLTEKQTFELMRRYYVEGEKVESLLNEYKILTTPSKLVSLFPPQIHRESPCIYCGTPMETIRKGRSSTEVAIPKCPLCKHSLKDCCNCATCTDMTNWIKNKELEKRQELIMELYSIPDSSDELPTLTATDSLLLLAIARHWLSEDLSVCEPFNQSKPPFSPQFDLTNKYIKHLYAKGHISISPFSKIEAFEFNENGNEIDAYYPSRVTWLFLPRYNNARKIEILDEIEISIANTDSNLEFGGLWREVAKFECLEYYDYQLRMRNFVLGKFGDKTHSTFELLLERFSVGQIFNLTWQSVRDINDYIITNNIPNYKGKNMFVGAIQRKADKVDAEGWVIKNSRRDFNCPQSVLSSVLFDKFLGIGQSYLKTIPPKASSSDEM